MTIKRMTKNDIPLSFSTFKPIGHVVVAMPDDASAAAAIAALQQRDFEADDILHFSAAEEGDRMDRMLQHVSGFAGFGYEVTLMRRYQKLAREVPDHPSTVQLTGVYHNLLRLWAEL